MDFWYILIGIVVFIALFPCFRCFFIRLKCARKIKKLCQDRGYNIYPTHTLWFLGSKHVNKCDFYIETEEKVFSIKLFGVVRRFSILVFRQNGEFFIKNYIAYISYGSNILLSFDSKPKTIPAYNFQYKYKNEWKSKTLRNVLLVNPVSMELRYQPHNGGETIINAGDTVNGMDIYSSPQLLKLLNRCN